MKASERLLQRLRDLGFRLSDRAEIVRTYAGKWQRLGWAWSWAVRDPENLWARDIGSSFTVGECARAKELRVLKGRDTCSEIVPG